MCHRAKKSNPSLLEIEMGSLDLQANLLPHHCKGQLLTTRQQKCIAHLPYHDRLKYLNLTSLELRRHRGDLIETFKILKGLEGIPSDSLFELNTYVTRGNSLKLNKPRSRLNIRYNNFSQRVINAWNQLPERVISSTTVSGFKNNLHRHFQELHGVSMTWSLNP